MEKLKRDFKGIWIPKEIWLDDNLTLQEKVFMVEINSLDNKDGCFASNKYFSEFFKISNQRCSQVINSLIKKNVIKSTLIKQGNQVVKRVLNILNTYQGKLIDVSRKVDEGIKETTLTYQEKLKDNNIVNNKSNNKNNKKKKPIKHKYGEYKHVLLSDKQYNDLLKIWDEVLLKSYIKKLDEAIEMKGYKYTNFYLVLLNWFNNKDSENKTDTRTTEEFIKQEFGYNKTKVMTVGEE